MLPYADNGPSDLHEAGVDLLIAKPIAFQLGSPEIGVRTRHCSMLRATVPVAAIDEHGHSGRRKHDIGHAS
jgi:hypothetical protein